MPAEFPPEVLAEASEAVADPPPAGAGRDRAAVLHRRPGGLQGPRPGDVPGAHGRRLPRPLRHRRRAVLGRGRAARSTARPGAAARRIYAPDRSTPLHPETLSEDAASLLPGEARPAFVWDLRLDGDGRGVAAEVYRAMVRSVERMDYEGVQAAVDAGTADERLLLLKEVGERRIALEQARGGANLPMPEQEVTMQDGRYLVGFRPPVPAEDWNAQISLMTGMAAAEMMLQAPRRHPAHHARAGGPHGGAVPPAGPRPRRHLARGQPVRRVPALPRPQ